MELADKLEILADAAKYDVACTSSGVSRSNQGGLGNCQNAGICHSFAADGRCISLLKVLQTNSCMYDCKYCLNRRSNDVRRAAFTPRELADLTIQLYRRNYIEGLFLSSGVVRSPDYTVEQMIETLQILRTEYAFHGYIHVKAIPGADDLLIERLGCLADRMSVNIEMPSERSLGELAPDKSRAAVLRPMGLIQARSREQHALVARTPAARAAVGRFVPAGQSTQMIVGASPESDWQILQLTQGLYRRYGLKRVFFSAYVPLVEDRALPALDSKPPLLREHRLYQADWLLRFYGFTAEELLDEQHQNFNPFLDPKCNWAVNHPEQFPIEVNKAPYEALLRVPGIGVLSAQRILRARSQRSLDFDGLRRIGVVLKRAQYFLLCAGKQAPGLRGGPETAMRALLSEHAYEQAARADAPEQLSLFALPPKREELIGCLTGQI